MSDDQTLDRLVRAITALRIEVAAITRSHADLRELVVAIHRATVLADEAAVKRADAVDQRLDAHDRRIGKLEGRVNRLAEEHASAEGRDEIPRAVRGGAVRVLAALWRQKLLTGGVFLLGLVGVSSQDLPRWLRTLTGGDGP